MYRELNSNLEINNITGVIPVAFFNKFNLNKKGTNVLQYVNNDPNLLNYVKYSQFKYTNPGATKIEKIEYMKNIKLHGEIVNVPVLKGQMFFTTQRYCDLYITGSDHAKSTQFSTFKHLNTSMYHANESHHINNLTLIHGYFYKKSNDKIRFIGLYSRDSTAIYTTYYVGAIELTDWFTNYSVKGDSYYLSRSDYYTSNNMSYYFNTISSFYYDDDNDELVVHITMEERKESNGKSNTISDYKEFKINCDEDHADFSPDDVTGIPFGTFNTDETNSTSNTVALFNHGIMLSNYDQTTHHLLLDDILNQSNKIEK